MTVANVHDLQYLKDAQWEYHGCTILGDKDHLNAPVQLDLFESANVAKVAASPCCNISIFSIIGP